MVNEKTMNNSYQAQIIHGKGKHICINENIEENYNQILDVEDFSSQSQALKTLKISLTRTYSFPPIPVMILAS